ncbi:MAG: 6-phosphofructokinase [Candidatus Margulisbacteria bacterium]|nr:6-phosphofructokinase [Candidatus Margulisiibacteriota bacterium]
METIGVITPGGDAPGMNPAVRAVVRTAIFNNLKVFGIYCGWRGLIEGKVKDLELNSVSGIINQGGTMLHTCRTPEFKEKALRQKAMDVLRAYKIDALVVIGGDGSLRAAHQLFKDFKLPVIHVPASIDNDICGTDYSIGFDTAVNTAVEAIDKIRDTASSHERIFVVEVMGRHNGHIALDVGLVAGAEAILVPEIKYNIEDIAKKLKYGKQRGKNSFIIVVAEGVAQGTHIAKELKELIDADIRVSVLGHMQRGGSPSALSRETACKLGAHAVELLLQGKSAMMVGLVSDKVVSNPMESVIKRKRKLDMDAYKLAEVLAG